MLEIRAAVKQGRVQTRQAQGAGPGTGLFLDLEAASQRAAHSSVCIKIKSSKNFK